MTLLRPREHLLIGTEVEIANVLRNAERRGVLEHVGTPELLPDGRFSLVLSMLEPVPAETVPTFSRRSVRTARLEQRSATRTAEARRARRDVRRRRLLVASKVALVLVLLSLVALVGYGVYLLVVWVMANLAIILGTLAVVAVLVVTVLVKSGGCAGFHCRGCGHR